MPTPRRFLFVELLKLFDSQALRFAGLVVLCLTTVACTHEGRLAARGFVGWLANIWS